MNDLGKWFRANHDGEGDARHAMTVAVYVMVAIGACVLIVAMMGPFLYLLRCNLVGC